MRPRRSEPRARRNNDDSANCSNKGFLLQMLGSDNSPLGLDHKWCGTFCPGDKVMKEMITVAERRFPVRIRLGIPPSGLGQRHPRMMASLDEACGSNGWAMTPSGVRGVLNDAARSILPRAARERVCGPVVHCDQRRDGRG